MSNPCHVMDVNLPCFLCCVLRPLPLCTKIVDERLCLVVAIYGGASDFCGLVMAVIAGLALVVVSIWRLMAQLLRTGDGQGADADGACGLFRPTTAPATTHNILHLITTHHE